jgi:hypothetical protein
MTSEFSEGLINSFVSVLDENVAVLLNEMRISLLVLLSSLTPARYDIVHCAHNIRVWWQEVDTTV